MVKKDKKTIISRAALVPIFVLFILPLNTDGNEVEDIGVDLVKILGTY